ncbi:uncharacterized protein DSM5745_02943 [Aspergillus mulundensis]|uniref:Uncharacterized protein n=1 Tax=Aspergillus mulundensis TaxID=1810919 RepID=A0A3D8SJF6_9EURO|nr:Uncharacterized protein DSM5745_02943 [Aspergillus mulundensis]RDW86301.1 Uncharacterized protein DSM5745_02943 [Aspergillus mulundensis]
MYSLQYYIDSWIEVSSQPSSSSLSSVATADDIITTGLRVQPDGYHRRNRRRRLQRLAAVTAAQVEYSSHEPSSSQDEYEESESESDRVLSSSNEDIARPPRIGPSLPRAEHAVPSSDEDDSSTALGMRISSSPFVPQPNVFSHPPVSGEPSWTGPTDTRRSRPISDVSASSGRTAIRRNSQASVRSSQRASSQQHGPYNIISPSYHADHDAALRASLSTLLSCAAAARGLPKSESQPAPIGTSRTQPASFRLVSEAVAMDEEANEEDASSDMEMPTSPRSQRPKQLPQYSPRESSSTRAKRRTSTSKDRGSGQSATKKSRRSGATESSSAVMTWVISAGVVVLFSAISFSAGYVLGREVGRLEASTGMGSVLGDAGVPGSRVSATCGQEAVRGGLKRFRWSPGSTVSGVVA